MKKTYGQGFDDYLADNDLDYLTSNPAELEKVFREWSSPAKQEKKEKHPDADLKLSEVVAKLSRFVASQKIAIERSAGLDLDHAKDFVARADAALAEKTKKSDLLALITENSQVSRELNDQKLGRPTITGKQS